MLLTISAHYKNQPSQKAVLPESEMINGKNRQYYSYLLQHPISKLNIGFYNSILNLRY